MFATLNTTGAALIQKPKALPWVSFWFFLRVINSQCFDEIKVNDYN